MSHHWKIQKPQQYFNLDDSDQNEELRNANDNPSLDRPQEEINLFNLTKQTSGSPITQESIADTLEGSALKSHKAKRVVNQIMGIDFPKMQTISEKRKGRSKETANLSKYVFREVRSRLLLLATTNQLNEWQLQKIREFEDARGKLSSYEVLFEDAMFHRVCQLMAESAGFVRRIMASRRMSIESKILVVKFLERIRVNCVSPKGKWKERDII